MEGKEMIICEVFLTRYQLEKYELDADSVIKKIDDWANNGYKMPVKILVEDDEFIIGYLTGAYVQYDELYGVFEVPYKISVALTDSILSEIQIIKDKK